MKKTSLDHMVAVLRICIVGFILCFVSLLIFSFTVTKLNEDFLKQLGISKSEADKKIASSMLGGYLTTYGVRNAANLAAGNRLSVAKDLLAYTKRYTESDLFKKEYLALKESHKPKEEKIQTPEEFRKSMIENYKNMLSESEGYLKNATKDTKPVLEKLVADTKKLLASAQDPNSKELAIYSKDYPQTVKLFKDTYTQSLQDWEAKYPANQMLFVKQRLQQFLEETKDIDFTAVLTMRREKKIFVNPAYESRSTYWKMGFRAGKDVVEAARSFVQNWIAGIS